MNSRERHIIISSMMGIDWFRIIRFKSQMALFCLFLSPLYSGDKVKPIENYEPGSKMRTPEAAVIFMTAGLPALTKIQVDPDGRWFEFKGQKNEPVIFPVEVGKPVIIDRIYTSLEFYNPGIFYSESSRYTLKNTDKTKNQTMIHEPGLYYIGSVVHQAGNTIEDTTADYIVLTLASKKYPELFSKMKHVNFNIEIAKKNYELFRIKRAKYLEEERIKAEELSKKAKESFKDGLPVPLPINSP